MPRDDSRDNPPTSSIDLLHEPASAERWADETVTLALHSNRDLVLRAYAAGKAVEMVAGEGLNESISWWTVPAAQVPRVREAVAADLAVGAAGFDAHRLEQDPFLLEAVRDVIGTEERDEGAKIATRFLRWLASKGIPYEFAEQVREAY
jgi:hypothetical protein